MDVDYQKKARASFSNEEKKKLIDFEGSKLAVSRQCKLLGLSRSTAYHKPVEHKPDPVEISIKNAIYKTHYREPSYMEVKSITKEYMNTYNDHRDHQRHQYRSLAEIFFNHERKVA